MAGAILGASSALAVVAAALGGKISDQRGTRVCFLTGLPLKVFGCGLMAAASHNPWVGAVGLVSTYGSDALLGPAVTRAVADAVPLQLATTLGLLGSVRSLVPIAGSLASAIVAESLGWECLFLVKACLLLGVSVPWISPPPSCRTCSGTVLGYMLMGLSRLIYPFAPSLPLVYLAGFVGAAGNCLGSNAPVFAVRLLGERWSGGRLLFGSRGDGKSDWHDAWWVYLV